jgi:predicted ATP-dependent endonuclease of OLD family
LLNGLFEAYKMPTNQEFLNFIVRVEQDHNFNVTIMNADVLMESALKLYQTKIVDGSWDQMSHEQKQAINLMAQLNSFKSQLTPSRVQGGKSERQNNKTQHHHGRKRSQMISMNHTLKVVEHTTGAPNIKCTPCINLRIASYQNATTFTAKTAR